MAKKDQNINQNSQQVQQMPMQPLLPMGAPMMQQHVMLQVLPAPQGWRGRWLRRMGNPNAQPGAKNIWPIWLSQYGMGVYVISLIAVSLLFSSYPLPWYYMLSGVVSILIFFAYGFKLSKDLSVTNIRKKKTFEKRIFWIAFIPRVLFMLLMYWIFLENYGDAFGFENDDATYYDELGQFVARLIEKGNFHFYDEISKFCGNDDIADMGYGVYVGFIYWLTDNSVIGLRLLKCILSSWTVLLIYRLAKRNFGEQTARIAAIFCALWPNFWYYSACHLKETEMVFLVVLFVEQAEQMLRSRQFTAWKVAPVLLIGASLFTFRTSLALVAILSLIFSIVMSSSKVVSWGKRIIVGGLAISLIAITIGNSIEEQAKNLIETAQSGGQQKNMEWRATRVDEGGNRQKFAKYAGAAVFAPLIFTIPFPTILRPYEAQDMQQMMNGGYFTKNLLSIFVILSMIQLLLTGHWREHLLPLSFMVGYLVVLTMSVFAQSERFHQPVMPFELMFATYGLSIVTQAKNKRWFRYWCALMFVACIAWNWFKLAGRGLA